jgi:hypothetical protein
MPPNQSSDTMKAESVVYSDANFKVVHAFSEVLKGQGRMQFFVDRHDGTNVRSFDSEAYAIKWASEESQNIRLIKCLLTYHA